MNNSGVGLTQNSEQKSTVHTLETAGPNCNISVGEEQLKKKHPKSNDQQLPSQSFTKESGRKTHKAENKNKKKAIVIPCMTYA